MKDLKRLMLVGLCWLGAIGCLAAMNPSEVRGHARFMTDRMGHELGLSLAQRNDVYEINYDFFASLRYVVDDLAMGEPYAVNKYYESLDWRNEDLSHVLTRSQFERFIEKEHFYRPLRTSGRGWEIRIYSVYSNPSFFYYTAPVNFLTYAGLHSRAYYRSGYYCNRYHHPRYVGPSIRPPRPVHRPVRPHRPAVSPRPHRPAPPTRPHRPSVRPERPSVRPNRPARPERPDHRLNVRPTPSRPEHRPGVRPLRDTHPSKRPDYRRDRQKEQ